MELILQVQIMSALKLYTPTTKGKSFPHLCCYHILSKATEWHNSCEDLNKKKKLQGRLTKIPTRKYDITGTAQRNKNERNKKNTNGKRTWWNSIEALLSCWANETKKIIELYMISKSRKPFYEWKQKQNLEKIKRDEDKEKRVYFFYICY
ncbi:hypothetical protein VP01_2648g5, partial [Puccinia sorghi]